MRAFVAALAVGLVAAGPADAAKKSTPKKEASQKKKVPKKDVYSPPSAALVVDANTGKVLYTENADAIRHPASLTKVMTLYLLFDELERGSITLDTRLKVSANAARQAPSKLGLQPGETIRVEDAIKAVVTKSANDVAYVIAENLGGTESAFAERMTRRARALGMNSTVYRNANGLPNSGQVTTARDLVLLGRAIQDNHPTYYRYFSTRSFTWKGRTFGNHNNLLGKVKGVDGIKTGFIRASGFNLLTSANDNGRSVVAVVLGGRSGASRDAQMRKLIADNMGKAARGNRTAPLIAASPLPPEPAPTTTIASLPAPSTPLPAPRPAETGLQPAVVASVAMPIPQPVPASVRTAEEIPGSASGMTPDAIARRIATATAMVTTTTTPSQGMRWVVGSQPVNTGSIQQNGRSAGGTTPGSAPALPAREVASIAPARAVNVAQAPVQASLFPAMPQSQSSITSAYAETAPQPATKREAAALEVATPPRDGWLIQIGATDDPQKALALLDRADPTIRKIDSKAEPFTEPVAKGDVTLYRARFAGFSERSAVAACKALKRSSLSCFAIKN